MNGVTTTSTGMRDSTLNNALLARLAERWRPVGLFLASLDREGRLLWQDGQMPRMLALSLLHDAVIARQIKVLAESPSAPPASAARLRGQLPWIEVQLVPVTKRRKVAGWIALIGRTDTPSPAHAGSEEVQQFAARAAVDAQALVSQSQKVPLVPAALFGALAQLAELMHDDLNAAGNAGLELANVTEQLTSVYEEISLLYKISSGMRFSQKPETFLETVSREVQGIGNYSAVIVARVAAPEDAPGGAAGNTMKLAPGAVVVGNCRVAPDELIRDLAGPIGEALATGETQVHNHPHEELQGDNGGACRGVERFVCVPLEREHRPLGILVAIDKQDKSEFNSVDIKLLNNVGSQCSIFLENAALYQDMQGLFMGVLHALTRSIDAKDAYTRGHSQRVAELSRALARKIGLSDEECERIYLSGLLHDVGKIGVPEAVLTKPGRLTDEEFDAIKKHPTIGAQILGNIKQLQDIIPGVLYHHERWDGRGYPHQIAGEAIPLMGRIICVADSFDAMSSTRTYRPALPMENVLAEILRCSGAQFDPALAKVFVTLDFEPFRISIEEAAAQARTPLLETFVPASTASTAPANNGGGAA